MWRRRGPVPLLRAPAGARLAPLPLLCGKAVEASTVVPQILALGLNWQVHTEETVHRVGILGVRMGIVGGEDYGMAVPCSIDVLGRPLVALRGGKALPLEVRAGRHREFGMFVTSPLIMFVQAPQQPGHP